MQPKSKHLLFSFTMALGSFFIVSKMLILAKFLDKPNYGDYSYYFLLASNLFPLFGMGILDGCSRLYPLLLGQNKRFEAKQILNQSFSALFILVVTLIIFAILIASLYTGRLPRSIAYIASHIALNLLFLFFLRAIRSELKSLLYAYSYCLKSLVDILLSTYLGALYGLSGALIGDLITLSLSSAVLWCFFYRSIKLQMPKWTVLRQLVLDGLYIMLSSFLGSQIFVFDRSFAGKILDSRSFAEYAFIAIFISLFSVLANMLFQYISPIVMQNSGKEGGIQKALTMIQRIEIRSIALAAILFFPTMFLADLVISYFFIEYPFNLRIFSLFYIGGIIHLISLYPLLLIASRNFISLIKNQILTGSIMILSLSSFFLFMELEPIHFAVIFLLGRSFNYFLNRHSYFKVHKR